MSTTFNTTTTNNSLVNTIIVNRGFSNARINSKDVDATTVKDWHKILDELHSASYKVGSTCYNTEGEVDYSPIYDAIRKVYDYIGKIKGAKLRSDSNTATVLCAKATTEKVKKSAELQYIESKKRNSVNYLRELEATNGACEDIIAKTRKDIEDFDKQIEELKAISGNQWKVYGKVSASAFYKSVEDYIADMIENRLTMTEEEVQAEAEAKRLARRKKTAEKKAQKEAEAKVA